jgi:hypothetical protein
MKELTVGDLLKIAKDCSPETKIVMHIFLDDGDYKSNYLCAKIYLEDINFGDGPKQYLSLESK